MNDFLDKSSRDDEGGVHVISGGIDLFSDDTVLSNLERRERDNALHSCITELETLYVCYQRFRNNWKATSDADANVDGSGDHFDTAVEIERRKLRGRFSSLAFVTSKNDDPVHTESYRVALSELRMFNEVHPVKERVKTWNEIHAMKKRHDDEWYRAIQLFFKDPKIQGRIYALKNALDDSLNRHDYASVIGYIQARVFHHTVHTAAQDLLVDLIFSKISHVANNLDQMSQDQLDKLLLPMVHEVLEALGDKSFDPNDPNCIHVFTTRSIFQAILTNHLDPA
ncbi:MAG: hypothetical protein US89_C0004G0087 [Candidatus Peregrinibacteria bacterium GW2011_GWF2_38_29]|nr:MAG: hypothetical protein US89_C0004G0087 [Candidatus Peregrinibacteria bacterium GW2011_GWF2_38_29]HBB03023.1 hypothetical protein [Candidatus Peregrinibacteria bacterium]